MFKKSPELPSPVVDRRESTTPSSATTHDQASILNHELLLLRNEVARLHDVLSQLISLVRARDGDRDVLRS